MVQKRNINQLQAQNFWTEKEKGKKWPQKVQILSNSSECSHYNQSQARSRHKNSMLIELETVWDTPYQY